ncbi:hypothetical protein [Arenimonas sp.]|uniref:hypothetical protein n=1 Tax=Arenimonas sp. TaxID=1872635 RepID=UPI0039E6FE98
MTASAPAEQVSSAIARWISVLPDALTSLAYLVTWFSPLLWKHDAVNFLMLVMLLEFLVVHSGAFIGAVVLSDKASRRYKTVAMLGFGAFYMLFAGAFSLAFDSWWPVLTFGWLMLAKFALIWLAPVPKTEEAQRQMTLWAFSVAAYLAAVFMGVILPLPRFGLGAELVAQLQLPGSGLWIEKPHTVIAGGFVYFGLLAWMKWKYRPEWARNLPAGRRS